MKLKIIAPAGQRNIYDVYRATKHVAVIHLRDNGDRLEPERRYEFDVTLPQGSSPESPDGQARCGATMSQAVVATKEAWIKAILPAFTPEEWSEIERTASRHRFGG